MSSCEKDVIKIGKQIEKLLKSDTKNTDSMDLLSRLKELPITLEILQKTRIGMSVNNLRKQSNNEEINTLAKSLIKRWKKLLPSPAPNKSSSSQKEKKDSGDDSREPSPPLPNGSGDNNKSTNPEKPKSSTPVARTNDSVREKSAEMIGTALKVHIEGCDHSELGNADEIASEIEDCIYTEFLNTDMKYKSRIRSRVSNLKDGSNPELRKRVLNGEITPEKIAKMPSLEMASKELKTKRESFTKEAIQEHQMAVTSGTKTDLLKCGKCQKRNCSYNQVQTRSADEPMTTFAYCHDCGHRWKFC